MKMRLNFSAMAYLVAELTKNEMWAIYVMGCGKKMPDQVTKSDLVRIIHVLCKKLDWIEVDQVEALTLSSGEGKTVNSFDFSSSRVSEPAIGNSPETGLVGDNSLSGSKTVNNDLENGRNICANEVYKENYDCDISTAEATTSNENISKDPNVLSLESKDFERNRSMDSTKEVPHKTNFETTGVVIDLSDLQPHKCLTCNHATRRFPRKNTWKHISSLPMKIKILNTLRALKVITF